MIDEVGKKVVLAFLNGYEEFGSRGHMLAAAAMRRSIEAPGDGDDKKVLAVKIYGEFISALEDLGALCIAVRHRDEGVGLVYGFLTYGQVGNRHAPQTKLKRIFELCLGGNALVEALRLPSIDAILSAAPDLHGTPTPQLYKELNIHLSQAAKAYLHADGAFVRAYNKTKHGFVVVNDRNTFQDGAARIEPDVAWITAENLTYDPANPSQGPVVELFAVRLKNVDPTFDRIVTIRGATMTICALTAILLERGIVTSADSLA